MDDLRVQFNRWRNSLPEGRVKRFYQWLSFRIIVGFSLLALAAIVFAKLANEVRQQDTLGIDRSILFNLHNYFESKTLDSIVALTTNIGGTVGVLVIAALFIGACVYKRRFNQALFVLVATGGAVVLNLVLKSMFMRARPNLWERLVVESGYSFPSGHAMASSALALAIIVALWNTRWRLAALIGGGLYIAYVGFTRLYLGVHYPTDILGAWVICFAWVMLVLALLPRANRPT